MTMILFLFEKLPLKFLTHVRPDVGLYKCAITNPLVEFFFFLLPIATLNLFSLLFIASTGLNLLQQSRIKHDSGYSRFDAEKTRFMMYLQLFGFMSVIWAADAISFFYHHKFEILPEIALSLQGVVIFVIFVLQKNVRSLIMQRMNFARSVQHENDANEVL